MPSLRLRGGMTRTLSLALHGLLIIGAHLIAYAVRFDGTFPPTHLPGLLLMCAVSVPVYLATIVFFGVHRSLWRYVGIRDVLPMAKATGAGLVVAAGIYYLLPHHPVLPRSVPVLGGLFIGIGLVGTRMAVRLVRERHLFKRPAGTPVLIYGAGDAGNFLASELTRMRDCPWYPVGMIDDNPHLTGSRIGAIPILGTGDQIAEAARKTGAREVIIAIPSADRATIERIVGRCDEASLPANSLPSLHSILVRGAKLTDIHRIDLEDLLSRDPVRMDLTEIRQHLSGKRVLVTGAGGSIGSELCRQILAAEPHTLILLDRYENSLADLLLEIAKKRPESVAIRPLIGDVGDEARMRHVFDHFRPHCVFHAAAHKHVPMMEWNPIEAIKNNVLGTRTVARMANEFSAEHFTLISTDKAVNPTNVMGASKRIAEMLVQGLDQVSATRFSVVRFGNVLGSNGSVVPIFQRQIQTGGPVTVTHPDIRRFFMTIPEAVQLVIRSSNLSRGGEIFVLDMGEQVQIVDLARQMIRLAGFRPDKDIRIAFTGLRPGEKLYEELFDEGETVEETGHPKLRRARGRRVPGLDPLDRMVDYFVSLPPEKALEELPAFLCHAVPSYRPDEMRGAAGPTEWQDLFPLISVLGEEAASGASREHGEPIPLER